MCIAFVQIRLRRLLSESLIKLDVKECCISTIKASDSLHLFGSMKDASGFETTFELQNPGIPSKNSSSSWSWSKESNVRIRARASISDETFKAASSDVFSIPPTRRL